jgi:hypothetical protein
MLTPTDLGPGWQPYELPEEQQIKDVSGCSASRVRLPGEPKTIKGLFGAPGHLLKGANYATYVAVYADETAAFAAFDVIKTAAAKCSAKKVIPSKTLSEHRFTLAHTDTWSVSTDSVAGWMHLRGTETDTYSAGIGVYSTSRLIHDYALRGNVVFTSLYWQRLPPKKSSAPIAKKATEFFSKQLEKAG